jgi:hypothetical protein
VKRIRSVLIFDDDPVIFIEQSALESHDWRTEFDSWAVPERPTPAVASPA